MENTKFYFVCFEWTNSDRSVKRMQNTVIDEHPFQWLRAMRMKYPDGGYGAIVGWQ